MRFVIVGAGAIGGVLGASLARRGYDVVLVARGAHADAIARHGLTLRTPAGTAAVAVPVVTSAADLAWAAGDVAVLAVKSQDTAGVLEELAAVAPPSTPVVCLQNGVDNERAALRRFGAVYGVVVMCPAGYLEPGVVEAYGVRTTGVLDVGRYPSGVDDVALDLSAAFAASGYESVVRDDVMRWKWAKLVANLANAVDAVCEPGPDAAHLVALVRAEGRAVLAAAGIEAAGEAEEAQRRGDLLQAADAGLAPRLGSSTWQSLARGTGEVETDYLTGEIVLLGRLHGVATPVNEVLQRHARRMAVERRPPAEVPVARILAEAGVHPLS